MGGGGREGRKEGRKPDPKDPAGREFEISCLTRREGGRRRRPEKILGGGGLG